MAQDTETAKTRALTQDINKQYKHQHDTGHKESKNITLEQDRKQYKHQHAITM